MTKYDLKPIIKTFYDALEEGTILGRKCQRCGHVEFPPFLCCNDCGCLDTEWVDLTNMRGVVKQALPTRGAFGDPEFRQTHGDYFAIEVHVPGVDPFSTSLLHVDYDKYAEFDKAIDEMDVVVKPLIIQDEDVKVVVWEIEGESEFKKIPELKPVEKAAEPAAPQAVAPAAPSNELDEIAKTVISCAADAYGVDAAGLTLSTDIREDLSNESMKMIVMISEIEDRLKVTIEIQEASQLNTLGEFTATVRERLGLAPVEYAAEPAAPKCAAPAAASEELDEVAKTVFACAADAYGVDAAGLTLSTDIREDLSNESMKMIVMISEIEDRLRVTIEIQEASQLNTLGEFTAKVKERL